MIKDSDFFRMKGVPITKEEIRAVSVGKLQLNPDDVVVDIGCGSGGMTVEIARRCKFVYAIDVSDDAVITTKKNIDRFNIKNCKVIKGNAEEILLDLEFNKAFIGGTKNINKILSILKEKNINHIVANTIVLENAVKIIDNFNKNDDIYDIDVVNVTISYGKKIGAGYMMMAKNPIIIITVKIKSEGNIHYNNK
jgi:cobalt-precorrin-6B (C15)-methyltransferase